MSETLKVSNGDLFIDPVTGRFALIDGPEKAGQDVAECLMTLVKQSNRSGAVFPRNYGSELATIGTSAPTLYGGAIGKPLVAAKVQEAISRLQSAQGSDPNITDNERITAIQQLLVEQTGQADFVYYLQLGLASGDLAEVTSLTPTALDHQFPLTGGLVDPPSDS